MMPLVPVSESALLLLRRMPTLFQSQRSKRQALPSPTTQSLASPCTLPGWSHSLTDRRAANAPTNEHKRELLLPVEQVLGERMTACLLSLKPSQSINAAVSPFSRREKVARRAG